MTTFRYQEKVALIPPKLRPDLISSMTKHARITLSPSTLVPGQPFDYSWDFVWYSAQQPTPPSIHLKVSWNQHILWDTQNLPLSFQGNPPRYVASKNNLPAIGKVALHTIGIAKEFYKSGEKQIDLEIVWIGQDWDGTTSGKITTFDKLAVILDDPVDSWWDWTSPTRTIEVDKNKPYSVAGKVTNRHKFADAQSVTVNLWKWEQGHEDKKWKAPSKAPFSLAVGASMKINLGSFQDDWEWMDDCLWWTAVFSKEFNYQVDLEVLDEFENRYSDTVSQTRKIFVSVPAWKIDLQGFSCGTGIGGFITKVIGGLFSPASGALFGGFYYLKDWLTRAALNPAQPDPDFKSEVIRPEIPFDPEDAAFGEGLPAARRFLKVALELSVLGTVRRSIAGKILGARLAGQQGDERMQRESYSKVLGELKEKAQTLQKLGDVADVELFELLRRGDVQLPDEIRLEELKGIEKLPPEALDQFMDWLASPDLEERVRQSQSLRYTAEALSQGMDAIEEEDAKTLAGGSPG